MKMPKLDFDQTIQRVSQMRRLALSLREAYEQQYELDKWLERFERLRTLPEDCVPAHFSKIDRQALSAGFRECWAKNDFETITEVAKKTPADVIDNDPLLSSYANAALKQSGN